MGGTGTKGVPPNGGVMVGRDVGVGVLAAVGVDVGVPVAAGIRKQ